MLAITCLGIIILIVIQLILYKRNENKPVKSFNTIKTFIISNSFLDVIKELLVILLGVTLALNFSSIVERNQTKEKVIKLLEVARDEMEEAHYSNIFFTSLYEQGDIEVALVKANIKDYSETLKNILANDTIMTTISPFMYGHLLSDIRSLNAFYEYLDKVSDDESNRSVILSINFTSERILLELDAEIKHLQGIYCEQDLRDILDKYLDEHFEIIDEIEFSP